MCSNKFKFISFKLFCRQNIIINQINTIKVNLSFTKMQEMNSETSRNQEDMQENPESYANKINQNQEEESKDSTIINQ